MFNLKTMLDFTPLESWHLLLFMMVFSSTYVLLQLRALKTYHAREQGAVRKIKQYAGIILLGVTVLVAFFIVQDIALKIGLGAAAVVVALVGRADEIQSLSPKTQFLWQLVIVLILVTSGWTIPFVSNPWAGGILKLDWLEVGTWLFPGSVLAALWLLFFMNSINWLDGVDGLAGSVVLMALLALVAVSLLPATQDRQTLVLALTGAAALLAFVLWNFPPAQIYLGTTGSWFIGLYVALVAMIGGGKIITTALVLALPALDALYVIVRRLWSGRRPWHGDTVSHWHHRLLGTGVSTRSITLAAAALTAVLAAVSIMASTPAKLGILTVVVLGFVVAFLIDQGVLKFKVDKS